MHENNQTENRISSRKINDLNMRCDLTNVLNTVKMMEFSVKSLYQDKSNILKINSHNSFIVQSLGGSIKPQENSKTLHKPSKPKLQSPSKGYKTTKELPNKSKSSLISLIYIFLFCLVSSLTLLKQLT
jgi:hypothetical protein